MAKSNDKILYQSRLARPDLDIGMMTLHAAPYAIGATAVGMALRFATPVGLATNAIFGLASVASLYHQFLYLQSERQYLAAWDRWGNKVIEDFNVEPTTDGREIAVYRNIPEPESVRNGRPVLQTLSVTTGAALPTVKLRASNWKAGETAPSDLKLLVKFAGRTSHIDGAAFKSVVETASDAGPILEFEVELPPDVLTGAVNLALQLPERDFLPELNRSVAVATDYRTSAEVGVDVSLPYAYASALYDGKVVVNAFDPLGATNPAANAPIGSTVPTERIILREGEGDIPAQDRALELLASPDGRMVFVATGRGIAVIDGITLTQLDVDADTPGMDLLSHGVDRRVSALAISTRTNLLFAANSSSDGVVAYDINPTSDTFLKPRHFIAVAPGQSSGWHDVIDMGVFASGDILYVGMDRQLQSPGLTRTTYGVSSENYADGLISAVDLTNIGSSTGENVHFISIEGELHEMEAASKGNKLAIVTRRGPDAARGLYTLDIPDIKTGQYELRTPAELKNEFEQEDRRSGTPAPMELSAGIVEVK